MADERDIALAIYERMWRYYVQTIDNRESLFNWYFKIVALPAAAMALLAAAQRKGGIDIVVPAPAAGAVLLAVYVAGVALVVAYAKMSRNSFAYYDHAQDMEEFLWEQFPGLAKYRTLRQMRGDRGEALGELRLGSINGWRAAVIVALNTAIGSSSFALFVWKPSDPLRWLWVVATAALSVVLHVRLYAHVHGPVRA